jgi:hypothetical protein
VPPIAPRRGVLIICSAAFVLQYSNLRTLPSLEPDLKIKVGDVVVGAFSDVMAKRSKYFAALLAHPTAERATRTVDLTEMCRDRDLVPADIQWLVEGTERGRAQLPARQEQGRDGGDRVPQLIRLLRGACYFGEGDTT